MLRLTLLLILTKMAVSIDPEIQEKYLTLPEQEFIDYFNRRNLSWKITSYDHPRHFGISRSIVSNRKEYEIKCESNILKDIPKNFDAREKWKDCETIREINDQGICGSCWTFGTANTASDRTCIHKGINVHLAEQDFECLQNKVCDGGHAPSAFEFWQLEGLVSNKCKSYNITKLQEKKCNLECDDKSIRYTGDKHFAEVVYGVCNVADAIKTELVTNGPIEAGFNVFEDFMNYRCGIYIHTYGKHKGEHSVRIIGYGEEDGLEYWLVANSWGKGWGEDGIFKIRTFQKAIGFENDLFTGIPKK